MYRQRIDRRHRDRKKKCEKRKKNVKKEYKI